ncbi:DUF7695 domain-containing protein [Faecalibacterium sp. 9]
MAISGCSTISGRKASCAVDGGHEYLRRCGNPEDWEELSETKNVDD